MSTKTGITYLNIIDTIDNSILELKQVKQSKHFSSELTNKISNIFNFIKTINSESLDIAISNIKSIYIEKEVLENIQYNVKNINIQNEDIDEILQIIKISEITDVDKINTIQELLMKISIPIWESLQEIN